MNSFTFINFSIFCMNVMNYVLVKVEEVKHVSRMHSVVQDIQGHIA